MKKWRTFSKDKPSIWGKEPIGDCETYCLASFIVPIVYSNADTLSLREKRNGAKLMPNFIRLNTSLSAGVFQGSAYGTYNLHNLDCKKRSFSIAYKQIA